MLSAAILLFAAETTTVVREMAKCSTPIQIVYSGEKTKAYADRLVEAIQLRKDYNNKKDLSVRSIQEYEQANQPAADTVTVVALVSREELDRLPTKLATLFASANGTFDAESCTLITQMPRAKAGQITFDCLIQTPMASDLNGALDRFMNYATLNWRDLKFNTQLRVNRVYTSGTNVLNWIPGWGAIPGNVINTVTYGDTIPAETSTGDQVYFWNRSNISAEIPPSLKQLVESIKLNPLTYAALRQAQPNGHYASVFIAPSERTLEHLAGRFQSLQGLSDPGFLSQVNDLRENKRTLVQVTGYGLDREVADAIGGYFEADLRDRAHLNLLQRSNVPDLIGQGAISTESAAKLRSDYGVRWVVSIELSDAVGNVDYRPEEICLSNEPAKYAETPPSEPVRSPLFGHRLTDEEWAKAQEKYRKDTAEYNKKRDKYEYEDRVSWRKNVVKKSFGQIRASFKLIDLQDNSRVIWLGDQTGKIEETSIVRTTTETVNGHMRKPRSFECPRPESNVPAVIKSAGDRATAVLMKNFVGESLLPSEDVSVPVSALEIKTIAVESPLITINAGEAQGIKLGDKVVVEVFRDIVDPNTKEVIERVPIDKITLVVVRVGKTSDCKATEQKDLDLLAKIKIGDPVRIIKS